MCSSENPSEGKSFPLGNCGGPPYAAIFCGESEDNDEIVNST